jgi:hypothetical protein
VPCDSIVRCSISFRNAVGHIDLLAAALTKLGYRVVRQGDTLRFDGHGVIGTYANGEFQTSGYAQFDVDEVKKEFGKQVVRKSARQYGWDVTEDGDNLQIRKRI